MPRFTGSRTTRAGALLIDDGQRGLIRVQSAGVFTFNLVRRYPGAARSSLGD